MSESDGICNKGAMCVLKKIEVSEEQGMYTKQEGTCRFALCVNR